MLKSYLISELDVEYICWNSRVTVSFRRKGYVTAWIRETLFFVAKYYKNYFKLKCDLAETYLAYAIIIFEIIKQTPLIWSGHWRIQGGSRGSRPPPFQKIWDFFFRIFFSIFFSDFLFSDFLFSDLIFFFRFDLFSQIGFSFQSWFVFKEKESPNIIMKNRKYIVKNVKSVLYNFIQASASTCTAATASALTEPFKLV